MDRTLILTLPSGLVLLLLLLHSWHTLPRRRAVTFWTAVMLFGVARGMAVAWVTEGVLGASFPYVIHEPLLEVFGVSLQEVAGWAIVVYLGWWLGWRFARGLAKGGGPRLFVQVAWASLFLGAVSWAVESAAVAAGWWHWRVPVRSSLLGNVPFIGLVDWFFVGVDFLLPFLALTAPALAGRPARWLTLLVFPLHFGAHALLEPLHPALPIPVVHLAHWALLGVLVWLALRSDVTDDAFAAAGPRATSSRVAAAIAVLPLAGLTIVLGVAAAVALVVARRPELLPSMLPAAVVALQTLRPLAGYVAGGVALAGGLALPPLLLGAVPAATAAALSGIHTLGRRRSTVATAAVALLAVVAFGLHAAADRRHRALEERLDRALAARDRGDLETAVAELRAAARAAPGEHAPRMLLGEILYRTDRLTLAEGQFHDALEIMQNEVRAYRFLTVIALRQRKLDGAREWAERGLAVAPDDLQLRYLAHHAAGEDVGGLLDAYAAAEPDVARALPSLAFEVGDEEGAAALLDRGLESWPGERWLYPARLRVALAAGDRATARHVAAAWQRRFPDDPEARRAAAIAARP